jgi:hypothetical protein
MTIYSRLEWNNLAKNSNRRTKKGMQHEDFPGGYRMLFRAFDTMRVPRRKKTNNILGNKNIIKLFRSFNDNLLETWMK